MGKRRNERDIGFLVLCQNKHNRKVLTNSMAMLSTMFKVVAEKNTELQKNSLSSIWCTYLILVLNTVTKISYGPRQANLYLSPMRAAKVQASLRIRAVSPEPSLLAFTSSKSRGTFRQKARSLAPLNGWACAVKICHDGMLEDTNSLDGAHTFCHTYCFSNIALYGYKDYPTIIMIHFFQISTLMKVYIILLRSGWGTNGS